MPSDAFWLQKAKALDWVTFPTKSNESSFHSPVTIRWFADGVLNACVNCVDRHLPQRADHTALIWEGDNPAESQSITYQQLYEQVCKTAAIYRSLGVQKGDRVIIYMPMIPEAVAAMLACARIGAVHSVVFGGFSATALASRIDDCGAVLVVTADEGKRGGKVVPLKRNVDEALHMAESRTVRNVLVVKHKNADINWQEGRDKAYNALMESIEADESIEAVEAVHPLFILYTSGSTGKPKGIVHSTGGYLTYALHSFQHVFDVQSDDVHWCSADIGWITGHSYVVYAPLAAGITTLLFEGTPAYPDYGRFWQVIDKHHVTLFYTAPTAIRALMKEGDVWLENSKRDSLRVLGSVGEPINPEAWHWYHDKVGKSRCPIVDTWWQTETGGILISALATERTTKAGAATKPMPDITPALLNEKGEVLHGKANGALCLAESWPGQASSIHGDHARFEQTYFSTFTGYYFTGDGAYRDDENDYWITGRMDDVLNVSGHRLGTAEIEAAINEHPDVAESAVVGYPHDIKGQGVYAFIILKEHASYKSELDKEINMTVRHMLGAVVSVDIFHYVEDVPKTRSGKIMRRILRKIAEGQQDFGDISTLADASVVEKLMQSRFR